MPNYPFLQVDAFTDTPLAGNPCAVVFNSENLDDSTMLAITREMNLAETAFVRRGGPDGFAARYFTPATEIPFAGHPTIATAFALVYAGLLPLTGDLTILNLSLNIGTIRVEIQADGGQVRQIVMTQRKPEFLAIYEAERVLPLFGLPAETALPGVPIRTVSTGTPQLMVPVRKLDDLRRAQMDIPAYIAFRSQADFFSPHIFCLAGATPAGQTFARHLDAPPDLPEDPFTGSATGGMAAYLWHYDLLERPKFTAEQGHWMDRPGQASVEVLGPRTDIQGVRVGGAAVLVAQGELILPR
jgi:trans-2,3-dihydro-3-hydroxyanthranilate isomerase